MTSQGIWLDHAMRKRDRLHAQRVQTVESVWRAFGLILQVLVGLAVGTGIGAMLVVIIFAFTVNHA